MRIVVLLEVSFLWISAMGLRGLSASNNGEIPPVFMFADDIEMYKKRRSDYSRLTFSKVKLFVSLKKNAERQKP